MFNECNSLIILPDISKRNTDKFINRINLFFEYSSLFSIGYNLNYNDINMINLNHVLDKNILKKSLLKKDEIINAQNEDKIKEEYFEELEKLMNRDTNYDDNDDYSNF